MMFLKFKIEKLLGTHYTHRLESDQAIGFKMWLCVCTCIHMKYVLQTHKTDLYLKEQQNAALLRSTIILLGNQQRRHVSIKSSQSSHTQAHHMQEHLLSHFHRTCSEIGVSIVTKLEQTLRLMIDIELENPLVTHWSRATFIFTSVYLCISIPKLYSDVSLELILKTYSLQE